MTETANILRSATNKSLVIMDEVGRGTSTEDGLSIAWAVSEYLLNTIRCKTLFATHYHELTRIEHPALISLCLDVLEQEGQVIFLKRIKPGASANSYGIHVAQLAGLPKPVILRAKDLLSGIQAMASTVPRLDQVEMTENQQKGTQEQNIQVSETSTISYSSPGLFSDEELVLDEILSSNPDNMSPIEALLTIARWKKSLSGQ